MKHEHNEAAYQDGAAFAKEVQQALKEGKTFDEMYAYPPERAAKIRDLWQEAIDHQDIAEWYKGYVSRWD